MKYDDIYFINANEALKVASQQNRWENDGKLQVCYYEGEKIESELVNLIHLPLNDFVNLLGNGTLRLPTVISTSGFEINFQEWEGMKLGFKNLLREAQELRNIMNKNYFMQSRSSNPDFNEKLRFYIPAHENTKVMRYASENIADTLKELGYEVYFDLYNGCEDMNCLKNMADFNPHATISINHILNEYLSDNVFHFVWIQDYWAQNQLPINYKLRQRDVIFHLTNHLGTALLNKKISSTYQPFCVNNKLFKLRPEIKRYNKILFIGSSYKHAYDEVIEEKKETICKKLFDLYVTKGYIEQDKRDAIRLKYNMESEEFNHIINYIERDLSLEYIIQNNKDQSIEVYGYGWDDNKNLDAYYKGPIEYGENLSMLYNSAKYCIVIGGYVMQQRTLEASASGSIPLVFDSRKSAADPESLGMTKSLLFFQTLDDFGKILNKNETVDLSVIVNENNFDSFGNKIVEYIKSFEEKKYNNE
ncbi:hypothetical protein [Poseidonibacter sp.]|uniref:hypothetical protein n=1 Tax=Poseidonibacter sp. TaxID=2321188 RepID=UPI003C73BB77